jgi:hypothetical protein
MKKISSIILIALTISVHSYAQDLQTVTTNGALTNVLTTFNGSLNVTSPNGGLIGLTVSNGMLVRTGLVTIGDHVSNSNVNLAYNLVSGEASFAFIRGNGVNTNDNLIETYFKKISNGSFYLINNGNDSIVMRTNDIDRFSISGNGNVNVLSQNLHVGKNESHLKMFYDKTNGRGDVSFINSNGTREAFIEKSPTNALNVMTLNTDPLVLGTNFTQRLKIAGSGNVGIGREPSTAHTLAIAGDLQVSKAFEPKIEITGLNPTLHLKGDENSFYPEIYFSGYDVYAAGYREKFTKLSGYGGFSIFTAGAINSVSLGTQTNTISKSLHTYQAENWSGYAQIGSIGLYGGAVYANAIEYISSTRQKIQANDYTGGLLMGYSPVEQPARDIRIASQIKTQYMGTGIDDAGQYKFDMVFGINSDGTGNYGFDPTERMRLKDNGQLNIHNSLAIGTSTIPDGYKLAVNGKIIAEKITVATFPNWPDYVFEKNFKLPTLKSVEQFIEKNGHLPNMPSATEVKKNGIELGEMNAKLLEKVEELTLYLINQQKQIEELKKEIKSLKKD